MKPSHPDAVFGPDEPLPAPRKKITYREVADYLADLDTRELTHEDADDVLSLLDFMHEHTIKLIKQNDEVARTLREREVYLTKREAEIALKQRAVDAIIRMHPGPQSSSPLDEPETSPVPVKRRYFWGN
jgi:hypothetical protein